MKILIYCQHILGLGHFFRSLEIARALERHEVTMIAGGERIDTPLPGHVRLVQLPGLMMDADFKDFLVVDEGRSVEDVQQERREIIYRLFQENAPDVLLVELYPFGRNAFRFELLPVLGDIKSGRLPPCRVICSVRDILVEKKDPQSYERRVVGILNEYFNDLLIHADPVLTRLDQTFSRMGDIAIPVTYTGFVTPRPGPRARDGWRRRLGLDNGGRLLVASAGGGKVGSPLLNATVEAFRLLPPRDKSLLYVLTGPFIEPGDYRRLEAKSGPGIVIQRFIPDFTSFLAAADLSVSMAGYNTCMNILSAGTPALVWPFAQNREQRLRAESLASLGLLEVLNDRDLIPERLAARMTETRNGSGPEKMGLDLKGAAKTASYIENLTVNQGTSG